MMTVILTTETPGHRHCLERVNMWFMFWPISSLRYLSQFDRIITLGVPILGPEYLSCGPEWLNLHGGNPEHYRGLDSHWWAIYHNDWPNIVTTLHWIDAGIDTGDICWEPFGVVKAIAYTQVWERPPWNKPSVNEVEFFDVWIYLRKRVCEP